MTVENRPNSNQADTGTQEGIIITPERAKAMITQLGFKSWIDIPLDKSDYLYGLVVAITTNKPVYLNDIHVVSGLHRFGNQKFTK